MTLLKVKSTIKIRQTFQILNIILIHFKKSLISGVDLFERIFLFVKVLLLNVFAVHGIHETCLESCKQIYM